MDESPDYKALYQRAENARIEAENARIEAKRERNLLKSETQPTIFLKFIKTCHVHISQPLQVEINKAHSTGGLLTSPKGYLYPTYLQP
jgi:hypothetical protein